MGLYGVLGYFVNERTPEIAAVGPWEEHLAAA